MCEDVLCDPDTPVQVEDGVRGAGGDHQGVPRPLDHHLDDEMVILLRGYHERAHPTCTFSPYQDLSRI